MTSILDTETQRPVAIRAVSAQKGAPQTWLVTCVPYNPPISLEADEANRAQAGDVSSTPTPISKKELAYICVFCQEKIVGKEQRVGIEPTCRRCYLAKVPLIVRRSVIILPSRIDANDHMERCQVWIKGFPDTYRVVDIIDYQTCGIILYECPRTPVQE